MRYHFIGIGGIGMSALARILLQRGISVSGSDIASSAITENLKADGAEIFIGHAAENLKEKATVVYNTMIAAENPEYQEAQKKECPLIHRSDLLKELMEGHLPLLVSGTHGKTTTSSLLAHVLSEAGLSPSFAIGGVPRSLGSNGSHGKGKYFVAEADESDGSFLKYQGYGAIITNIDNDHIDHWGNEEKLIRGFHQFAQQVKSADHLFYCHDDEKLRALKIRGVGYGFGDKAPLHVTNFHQEEWRNIFDLRFEGRQYTEIEIPLVGGHNVLNAAAVFGLALHLNIGEDQIKKALSVFQGVGRRAEKKGEEKEILVYDDYAHHPTEIFATLHAIKAAIGKRRLVVAFQPHRYSRTKECLDLFPKAFAPADELIVTDIYGAGEKPIEGITTDFLFKKISAKCAFPVLYFPRKELVDSLCKRLQKGDLLLTMGAGDITKVGPEVLLKLS